MRSKVPKYRHFKARNIGFVCWQGKRHYFPGHPYNSKASIDAYKAFLVLNCSADPAAMTSQVVTLPKIPSENLTVAAFADHFLKYAHEAYPGKRGEALRYMRIVTLIVERYGALPVTSFGPLKLTAIRDELANKPQYRTYRNRKGKVAGKREYRLSRRTINTLIGMAKRWFKWGVSQELIDPNQLVALQTVKGLAYGRSKAVETCPREPVEWSVVEKIFPHVSPVVADMIRLQWHTGCRAQNICSLCPFEVDTSVQPWVWRPSNHKGQWRGNELVIFIGPQAAEILRPYLDRPKHTFCFSPKEAREAQLRAQGKKVSASFRTLTDRYQIDTYQKALIHGIAAQAKPRIEQPYRREYFEAAGIEYWTPHQLRHAKAQMIRDTYGLEAAQAVLGHSSLTATQIYARKRLDLARELAEKCG
jgi:integrase